MTYQAHERVGVILLLLHPSAIWLALGAKLLAHSRAVIVHLNCADVLLYELVPEEQKLRACIPCAESAQNVNKNTRR